MPAATPFESSCLRCLYNIASHPLLSALPTAEQVVRLATAAASITYNSPDSNPSPVCYMPPPRYTSDPPIPHPTFNAPRSDNSEPLAQPQAPPATILPEFDLEAQLATNLVDSDISSNDKPFEILQPPPRMPLPAAGRPALHTHSRLAGPSLLLPPIPQPSATMSCALARGIATMPSPQDKTALYFSGKVDVKIKDFLKEYKELADGCGLLEQQKVETVIWYVNTT